MSEELIYVGGRVLTREQAKRLERFKRRRKGIAAPTAGQNLQNPNRAHRGRSIKGICR